MTTSRAGGSVAVPDGPECRPEGDLRVLYPAIEPYAFGWLDVGDGHRVFWQECGNPDGKPAVFVHGGPGGGAGPDSARFFDPERYRIVLLDQRMCGASTPSASDPSADFSANTTPHLVRDLERLREDRGIERWLVFGGSWGSTLSLAYAQAHPERVTELVLRGIFLLRRFELDWFYNGGAGLVMPQWRERFLEPLGGAGFTGDAIAAYHDLLFDPDPAVHLPAGVAWTSWESATAHLTYDPDAVAAALFEEQASLTFARIENHFFTHAGWLSEGQLLEASGIERMRHIPGVIIQGAYDLCCPATTAWDLHRAWPEAEFHLVQAGHSALEPQITDGLVRATDAFAGR
jgi:proline iminopeptidase